MKCVICGQATKNKTCSKNCLSKLRSKNGLEFYRKNPEIAPRRPINYIPIKKEKWEEEIEDRDFIEREIE